MAKFGFTDRVGVIPVLYSGAVAGIIASAVIGPRYGVYMPIDDQNKITGGDKD